MARAKVSCTRSSASTPAQRRARRCSRRACGYSSAVNCCSSMAGQRIAAAVPRAISRSCARGEGRALTICQRAASKCGKRVEDVAGHEAGLRARGRGAIAGGAVQIDGGAGGGEGSTRPLASPPLPPCMRASAAATTPVSTSPVPAVPRPGLPVGLIASRAVGRPAMTVRAPLSTHDGAVFVGDGARRAEAIFLHRADGGAEQARRFARMRRQHRRRSASRQERRVGGDGVERVGVDDERQLRVAERRADRSRAASSRARPGPTARALSCRP